MAVRTTGNRQCRELPDDAIAAIVEQGNQMKSPLSFLVIEHYAGAAGRIANDATAFLHRHLPWDFIFGAQWTDPLETPMYSDWARRGEDALRPYSAHAHLSTALDIEPEEVIETAFGTNLGRLRAIKREVRPGELLPCELQHKTRPRRRPAQDAGRVRQQLRDEIRSAMRRRPCRRFRTCRSEW